MARKKNRQSIYDPNIASSILPTRSIDVLHCDNMSPSASSEDMRFIYDDEMVHNFNQEVHCSLEPFSDSTTGQQRQSYCSTRARSIIRSRWIVFTGGILAVIMVCSIAMASRKSREQVNASSAAAASTDLAIINSMVEEALHSFNSTTIYAAVQAACHGLDSRTADCDNVCSPAICCFVDADNLENENDYKDIGVQEYAACQATSDKVPGGRQAYCNSYVFCNDMYETDLETESDLRPTPLNNSDSIELQIQETCSNRETLNQCELLCEIARCCFHGCDRDEASLFTLDCDLYAGCQGVFAGESLNESGHLENQSDRTTSPNRLDTERPTWSPTADSSFDSSSQEEWKEWLDKLYNETDDIEALQTTVPVEVMEAIPPAPLALKRTCSEEQLRTVPGFQECYYECNAFSCCYDEAIASCYNEEPNCVGYEPCFNLATTNGQIGFSTDGLDNEESLRQEDGKYQPPIFCNGVGQVLWSTGMACDFPVCYTQFDDFEFDEEDVTSTSPYLWAASQGQGFYLSRMDEDSLDSIAIKSYFYNGRQGMRFQVDEVAGLVIESFMGAFGLKMTKSAKGLNKYFDDGPGLYVVSRGTMKASDLNGKWTILSYEGEQPLNICEYLTS